MTAYYELSASLDELANHAMDRYLHDHAFRSTPDRSRYYISGIDEEIHHHGNRWTHDVGRAGSATFEHETPQQRHDHYRERLHHAFAPWDREKLPSAPDLRDYARLMFAAANQGFSGTELSSDVTKGSGELRTAFTLIGHNIARIDGRTALAFDRTYLAPLGGTVDRQACVASLLGGALEWESRIWHSVDVDLKRLVADALHKMDRDNEGGSLKDFLEVAAAAAKLGTILTGSPFVAGAATALGILKDLVPEERPDSHQKLAGDDPNEIIDSIEKKLAAINRWIRAHEDGIARALDRASAVIDDNLPEFDLSKPRTLLREEDRDDLLKTPDGTLTEDQKDGLRLQRDALKIIVNDGLRVVAGELDRSRHTSDRASSASVWLRSDDRVGIGDHGPYRSWQHLFDRHRHMLTQTARELRQAGQHLLIATEHLFDTDEQVNRDLHTHSRRVGASR